MYFMKYPYRSNFEYPQSLDIKAAENNSINAEFSVGDFQPKAENPNQQMAVTVSCTKHQGDLYYLTFASQKWPENYAQSELSFPEVVGMDNGETVLEMTDDFGLHLKDNEGNSLLEGIPQQAFGVSGQQAIFQFKRSDNDQFYGMGEKMLGMELSGKNTKFWNTDVWGDFDASVFTDGIPDPLYVSVPYIIIKRDNNYLGILIDNPFATFMSTDSKVSVAGQMDADMKAEDAFVLGSEHGQPNLVVIYGPSLAELTQKLQKLVGVTPLPPAWSLGYHQCRWGYESAADLQYLNASMDRFEIPCDGLWLDIEYMRGYRVFTFEEEKNFPDLHNDLAGIQKNGRRIIPIIDPGVKAEEGYDVYDSGKEAGVFCKNPQGSDFIGLVWPGETVFPDYSMEEGRKWWASWVKSFAETGITGAWLDMNDPSTGRACCLDMLYNEGKDSHYTYHNQYAMGMAKASRDGFQQAYPEDRPFLLSRSGFTGSSKYAAIWTGDNYSNYHYLKGSIACTLNLALSGIPFNGPDAGGFGGDTNAQLMIDWYKAGFLFPVFRNHSIRGSENQEPWVFDTETRDILIHYVRMRYKLRPYLYNLFINQEENGDAILRPLFYDFKDSEELPLGYIDDQFMVGKDIMQAPFVEEDQQKRSVVLPDTSWFSVMDSKWLDGGKEIAVDKDCNTTPLYIRNGAIIPMSTVAKHDHKFVSNDIEFHLFSKTQIDKNSEYTYKFDDGQTYGYKTGERSALSIKTSVSGKALEISTDLIDDGYGECSCSFVLYDEFDNVTLNGQAIEPKVFNSTFAGKELTLYQI